MMRGMNWKRGAETINALVKDELSAVETYRLALNALGDSPIYEELRRIENDHERAAALLQAEVAERGVEPATLPFDWGFHSFLTLKDREEKAIQDYERALKDQEVDSGIKSVILGQLLPLARGHLPVIDRFLRS